VSNRHKHTTYAQAHSQEFRTGGAAVGGLAKRSHEWSNGQKNIPALTRAYMHLWSPLATRLLSSIFNQSGHFGQNTQLRRFIIQGINDSMLAMIDVLGRY
jgi:hypothetical protein